METFEIAACIRGYHVYRAVWIAAVGQVFPCERETTNSSDRYAVAVINGQQTVGHLPRKMSRVCSLFLRRGGTIECLEGNSADKDPLGSGRLSLGFMYFRRAMVQFSTTNGLSERAHANTCFYKISCSYYSFKIFPYVLISLEDADNEIKLPRS